MPSINVDMTTSPSVIAAEKKNAKIIPTLLMVDNVEGAVDAVLTLVDRFTTSDTDGADPEEKTETRLAINVSVDACVSLKDELKDIEFLGAPEVAVETVPAPNCKVTMAYHYK
ncbi:hypothetical protein ES708_33735 [subsurface metagenome]|jgi:hypothetical protein